MPKITWYPQEPQEIRNEIQYTVSASSTDIPITCGDQLIQGNKTFGAQPLLGTPKFRTWTIQIFIFTRKTLQNDTLILLLTCDNFQFVEFLMEQLNHFNKSSYSVTVFMTRPNLVLC